MNENEWVVESDWTKVEAGQRVKLTNAESIVFGRRIRFNPNLPLLFEVRPDGAGWYLPFDLEDSWSLFVQAPPAVVLPTEPGGYLDKNGTAWQITARFPFREDLHAKYAPFTRLEPVPETAKKVLDRVSEILRGISLPNEFGSLGAEFGVEVDK
jgi:hypothetical protein